MDKLKDKTVFITGGLSGIGKACAISAAAEGGNIAIIDLVSPQTDPTMAEIRKINPRAIFINCTVSSFVAVQNAIEKTILTFGSLDIALNNAGIGGVASKIGEMTEEAWLQVININLNGVFNCMKHELSYMSNQKSGVIINMSSILGKVGFAGASHYVAAKHGIIGLTQTAALEYATQGIRINAICPGFIDTPLLTKGGLTTDKEIEDSIVARHPMKRLGSSAEIAAGFIFLASSESSFITGTALEIDGGYLAQ